MSFITMPIHWITRAALAPTSAGRLNCWKYRSAFWAAVGHCHLLALAHHSPGSPPGVVLAASPNCQVWAREYRGVGAFTLLRLHPANWLAAGHLVALQGQCVDYYGDQLASSSGDWKLPQRTSRLGKGRIPREWAFIRENKQCFMR